MTKTEELLMERFSTLDELNPSNQSNAALWKELEEAAVDILNLVGHDRDNIFVDIDLEAPPRVRSEVGYGLVHFTAIAAKDAASPPHVAIIVDLHREEPSSAEEVIHRVGRHMLALDRTSKCNYSVILTNTHIAILGTEYPPDVYIYSNIDESMVSNILSQLEPPENYPGGLGGKFPAGHHPNQTKLTRWLFTDAEIFPEYRSEIKTDYFDLNIDEYSELLYKAYSADTAQQKGDYLEDVAEYLFNGLNMLEVRDSGEIDLVLEREGDVNSTIFFEYSRFLLVECKNVGDSVSSKEVGYFEQKLRSSDVDLGFLIAWNGISGEDTGDDAQRIVDTSALSNPHIVIIDSDDLYRILDGKSLYEIIDEKLYGLRFD